ncbi:2-hydroxyacid dehydrogenase [Phytomonospora endophytica]|uniref:Glycerate dehydrogenase n=1 Tax=Phytomonospora endophytica TaxID=714109 RepID=A0A841FEG8_9ACTN|nr:NAD(P)-dependent oxidoreductase [Phytomonospora endophytica]MBB6032238.1 glycerate dehydrogenase [Phytomonospora endophytica]GIG68588.1 glycerate dehydrogenase [Phytomonospora endophytica]
MRIVYAERPTYLPERWHERFAALGEFEVFTDRPEPTTLLHRLSGADLAIVESTPLPSQLLHRVTRLRYLTLATTGHHIVDLAAAEAAGITVAHCPTYCCQAVAEHVFGLLLALVRQLPAADAAARLGAGGLVGAFLSRELRGMTLGLLGAGRIATAVAGIAMGFGMDVIATNRSGKATSGLRVVPLEQLLRRSDVLSLHVPLTTDTRGILSAERLSLLRPSALLVNTCSADLIDQPALARALGDGTLSGAALNAVAEKGADELRRLDNVVLSPGTAWYTDIAREANLVEIHENLTSYLRGTPVNTLTRPLRSE